MTRNERILKLLQNSEQSSSNLALMCDCPEASVRRSLQELRREGHNISFGPMFRLGNPQ